MTIPTAPTAQRPPLSEMRALFGRDGPFSALPGYQPRPAQLKLARLVARTAARSAHAMAELPCGTGKSLGYLVPAALAARESGLPAVISTGTLALQEQLVGSDSKLAALAVPGLRVAVLKGRWHYPCPLRIARLPDGRLRQAFQEALIRGLADRADFPIALQARWEAVTAAGIECPQDCPEKCPLRRAREKAGSAEVAVVNHALLAADREGVVVPKASVLIADEAHRLIDVFTAARAVTLKEDEAGTLSGLGKTPLGAEAMELWRQTRSLLGEVATESHRVRGTDKQESRVLLPDVPGWAESCGEAGSLTARLAALAGSLDQARLSDEETRRQSHALGQLAAKLGVIFQADDPARVRWVDRLAQSFHSAPLSVADDLAQVWGRAKAVVLVSATLAGPAGYDAPAFGLCSPRTLTAPTPFDYPRSCLLVVPPVVEPDQPEHAEQVAMAAMALAVALGGRTLVLFTSHAALQAVERILRPVVSKAGITLLAQGVDGERTELLARARSAPRSGEKVLLLGAATFWEGIDLVGDSLQGLVIARLPFDPPGDPLHLVRSRQYRDPFREYTLPRTALKLRQGFGRLIRRESDRGVVVVLDPRLRATDYGQVLAEQLPPATLSTAPLERLPGLVRRWMALDEAEEETG